MTASIVKQTKWAASFSECTKVCFVWNTSSSFLFCFITLAVILVAEKRFNSLRITRVHHEFLSFQALFLSPTPDTHKKKKKERQHHYHCKSWLFLYRVTSRYIIMSNFFELCDTNSIRLIFLTQILPWYFLAQLAICKFDEFSTTLAQHSQLTLALYANE